MIDNRVNDVNFDTESKEFSKYMLLYQSALKTMLTRLDVLNDEFKVIHRRNPIAHITSRLKSPLKIYEKLKRKNFEVSIESMWENLYDIAGIRIVCSFNEDIYRMINLIKKQGDIKILKEVDYIQSPKKNGYRSYHLLMGVPVYCADETVIVKVEIQIRTIAMDFWATLEHDLYYKKGKNAPKYMTEALLECANDIANIDIRMQEIKNQVDSLDDNSKKI